MKTVKKNKIIFPLCLVLAFLSCNKDGANKDVPFARPKPIYDNSSDKLWAHRINTVEDAQTALKEFNGIETDIYSSLRFNTSRLCLELFFFCA